LEIIIIIIIIRERHRSEITLLDHRKLFVSPFGNCCIRSLEVVASLQIVSPFGSCFTVWKLLHHYKLFHRLEIVPPFGNCFTVWKFLTVDSGVQIAKFLMMDSRSGRVKLSCFIIGRRFIIGSRFVVEDSSCFIIRTRFIIGNLFNSWNSFPLWE